MKLTNLSKAIGIMAILLTAMFWGCSQEDEFEYETSQADWNKTAMKKGLARRTPLFSEDYRIVGFFHVSPPGINVDASYNVSVDVYEDTINSSYDFEAEFITPPNNPGFVGETVKAEGSMLTNGLSITITIGHYYLDYSGTYSEHYYTTIIPEWKL